VTVGFLLNGGTVLLVESSTSTLPEPDNGEAVAYLRGRLAGYGVGAQVAVPGLEPEREA
jgi:hypothetical protein